MYYSILNYRGRYCARFDCNNSKIEFFVLCHYSFREGCDINKIILIDRGGFQERIFERTGEPISVLILSTLCILTKSLGIKNVIFFCCCIIEGVRELKKKKSLKFE